MEPNSRFLTLYEEATLVVQAQAGDRAAFDRLVRSYRPLLLGLAYMRTSSMEAADDLVQEVLTRAWQKLPSLQTPAAFPAWLKTITANLCSNWHGRVRTPSYLADEPASETWPDRKPTPLEAVLAQEKRQEHVTLTLLLRGFAVMLACNVPILRSMRLMATILPETQAEIWLTACRDIGKGDPITPSLARMTIFPAFVVELISVGEEMGALDSTLVRAADLLEYERDFDLIAHQNAKGG